MKIYISGPVPANRGFYRHPYLLAEARLKLLNHNLCDGIFMLEGWEDSKSAQVEYDYAVKNGKKIFFAGNENDMKKLRKLEAV